MIASVDTYLRFAEAVNRLDITESDRSESLPDLLGGGLVERGARAKTKGAIEGAKETFRLGDTRSRRPSSRLAPA